VDDEGRLVGVGIDRRGGTYAQGHMLVRMNSWALCSTNRGSVGPTVLVRCKAISGDMYNVTAKKATGKK
jgi:hypothetical protein